MKKIALIIGLAIIATIIFYVTKPEEKPDTSKVQDQVSKPTVNEDDHLPKAESNEKTVEREQSDPQKNIDDDDIEQKSETKKDTKNTPAREPRSGKEILKDFANEQILDSGWEYTNERSLHTLINDKVYTSEEVKVLNNLKVECKSVTCMVSGDGQEKMDVVPFLEKLTDHLEENNTDWDIVQLNIVDGNVMVAIYPPQSPK